MINQNNLLPEKFIIRSDLSYQEACEEIDNNLWKNLGMLTVERACIDWLSEIQNINTLRNYRSGMGKLYEIGLIDLFMTLQQFALINHNNIIDKIKTVSHWSECTRQTRAACYIAFTAFLNRRTNGMIKKALAKREGKLKTFSKVHHKVKTKAMIQPEWILFLEALQKINARDALIAKVILQGAKRVNEVLSLQTDQINWEENQITFIQSKTGVQIKKTIITYPQSIMNALRECIGTRAGYVFITSLGKPLRRLQLSNTFAKAGKKAEISHRITPHVLRASCITYLSQQGFHDSDIIKVSGHSSMEQVRAYDKSSESENASKKVFLVN